MKRLLIAGVVAGLAFGGFAPAQAADPPERTPIVITCTGTGGYTDNGQWQFRPDLVSPTGHGKTCVAWSPDTTPDPPPGLPSANPISIAIWTAGVVGSVNPAPLVAGANLYGVGDFSCGDGTLTKPAVLNGGQISYTHTALVDSVGWNVVEWTATFTDGVGELTGTAKRGQTTRTLTGSLIVDDGAATGNCDDSAGNSNVFAVFVLE